MQEIADLEEQFKRDKKEGMSKINEAEFSKVSDSWKLNEETDVKVRETAANLLAINAEQSVTQK